MQPIADSQLLPGLGVSYLKFFGKWNLINSFRTKERTTLGFDLQCALMALLTLPFLFCQLMYFVMSEVVSMEMSIVIALNTVTVVQMIVRQGSFRTRLKEQSQLFDLLRGDLLESVPPHKRAAVDGIYSTIGRRCNLFCYVSMAAAYLTDLSWTLNPEVRYANATDPMSGARTIIGGWYPFPFLDSPWAEIAFLYELLIIFYSGACLNLYAVIFTQQMMVLQAHQKALSYHLRTLTKQDIILHNGNNEVTELEADDMLYRELIAIVRDHQKLLRFGRLLDDSYGAYIAVMTSLGVIVLIINIFHLVFGGKDVLLSYKFVLYLTFEVVEFTVLCFNTTILETTSTDIQFSSYCTDWYKSDKKSRDAVMLLMVRSQKPVTILAFRTYPVNVTALISIFQFTYSAATLLSNVNG